MNAYSYRSGAGDHEKEAVARVRAGEDPNMVKAQMHEAYERLLQDAGFSFGSKGEREVVELTIDRLAEDADYAKKFLGELNDYETSWRAAEAAANHTKYWESDKFRHTPTDQRPSGAARISTGIKRLINERRRELGLIGPRDVRGRITAPASPRL